MAEKTSGGSDGKTIAIVILAVVASLLLVGKCSVEYKYHPPPSYDPPRRSDSGSDCIRPERYGSRTTTWSFDRNCF